MRIQAYIVERKRQESLLEYTVDGAYSTLDAANKRTGELNALGYDCRLSYDHNNGSERIDEYHYAPRRKPT